jgi:hypothetical protein
MKNGTESSMKLSMPDTAFCTMKAGLKSMPRSISVTRIEVPASAKATGTASTKRRTSDPT